jgi:hypothetical protein
VKRLTTVILVLFALSALASAAAAQSRMKSESLLGKGKYIPDIGTFLQIGAATPAGYSWDGKDVYF